MKEIYVSWRYRSNCGDFCLPSAILFYSQTYMLQKKSWKPWPLKLLGWCYNFPVMRHCSRSQVLRLGWQIHLKGERFLITICLNKFFWAQQNLWGNTNVGSTASECPPWLRTWPKLGSFTAEIGPKGT